MTARVNLLRSDKNGEPLPGGINANLTRVPCIGEFIHFPDSVEGSAKDMGPYRVTKVQHYPTGRDHGDAEVWVVAEGLATN